MPRLFIKYLSSRCRVFTSPSHEALHAAEQKRLGHVALWGVMLLLWSLLLTGCMPSEDTDWAKRHATLLSLTEAKNLEALEEWLAPEATGPEGQSREALLAFGERWFARSEAIALSADVWTREKDAEGVTTRSRLRVGQQMLGFGSVFTVTLRWVEAPDAPMGWHILWADWVWEPPSNMSGSRS